MDVGDLCPCGQDTLRTDTDSHWTHPALSPAGAVPPPRAETLSEEGEICPQALKRSYKGTWHFSNNSSPYSCILSQTIPVEMDYHKATTTLPSWDLPSLESWRSLHLSPVSYIPYLLCSSLPFGCSISSTVRLKFLRLNGKLPLLSHLKVR